jgi:hypothetical protein
MKQTYTCSCGTEIEFWQTECDECIRKEDEQRQSGSEGKGMLKDFLKLVEKLDVSDSTKWGLAYAFGTDSDIALSKAVVLRDEELIVEDIYLMMEWLIKNKDLPVI